MLEMRHQCEACERPTPADSADIYICSYECTFCRDCAEGPLGTICPNCGGPLQRRPIRQMAAGTADPT